MPQLAVTSDSPCRHASPARRRSAVLGAAFALATLAVTGLAGSSAEAAVAGPVLGTAVPAAAPLTENVRWVCGPWRCVWRPNNNYWYVPPYARAWGPPVRPNCYWHRNWGGAWVHTCP